MARHLIIFEGIEGSGKSTQAQNLFDFLTGGKYEQGQVAMTKEPGASHIGQPVRDLLLGPNQRLESLSELFLFLTDRIQHIEEVLNPLLRDGKTVILDRFSLSTIAYQGSAQDLDIHQVRLLDGMARSRLVRSEVTQLLLDLPVKQAMARIKGRDQDAIEQREISFHQSVATQYRRHAWKLFPTVRIDAGQSEQGVFNEIKKALRIEDRLCD